MKIKWLALIQALGYGLALATGTWAVRLATLAALGNFLLFFSGEIVQRVRTGRRRMAHQARAAGARAEDREPRHRCHVCGKTDVTDPQMDFRYCSKCAGDECYCADHLTTHEHTTTATKPR